MRGVGSLIVEIEDDSLCFGTDGVITGRIFLRCGDTCFPEASWNDFAAVVLTWWVEAILALDESACAPKELRFMDGPFWAEVSNDETDSLRFQFVDGRARSLKILSSGIAKAGEFKKSLLTTSERLLRAAESRRFSSTELDRLREATGVLSGCHRSCDC